MTRSSSKLMVLCVLFVGLAVDTVAQNNEYGDVVRPEHSYSYNRLEYAGRTTLKLAVAEAVARDEDRALDVEGTRTTVFARITQAVRPMSDETRAALSLWKSVTDERRKLDVSREEIEVRYGTETLWMPISRLQKIDLFRETQPGQGAYLTIRTIGRRENTPILFIEYVGSLDKMGPVRVFRDAVECATKLKDFTESLDIVEEIGKRWSGTEEWNQEQHAVALAYIRGLEYWDSGEYELAKKYLEPAEQYIRTHPDDDISSIMTTQRGTE